MPLKRYLQFIIVTERVDVFRRSDTREENIFGVFYFTHWLKVTAVVPAEDKKKTQQGLKTDCSKIQSMFIFLFLPAAVCACVCVCHILPGGPVHEYRIKCDRASHMF